MICPNPYRRFADTPVYTTYIPCEITGKYAEESAVTIEPGDVLQIAGKWTYKPGVIDPKTGAKIAKPVVSSWGAARVRTSFTSVRMEADLIAEYS
jgi:hypothetical protein